VVSICTRKSGRNLEDRILNRVTLKNIIIKLLSLVRSPMEDVANPNSFAKDRRNAISLDVPSTGMLLD
jgi:hypothetical protein